MQNVIVFGNDHLNTVGVIQGLGRNGYNPIALIWGTVTGFVKSSKYTNDIISAKDASACLELLLDKSSDEEIIPIVPCCDEAATVLEIYRPRLQGRYVFQYAEGKYTIGQLMDKNIQVQIASECGFAVPMSWELKSIKDIPKDIKFPCLIKPQVSFQGRTSDILVCYDNEDLQKKLEVAFKHSSQVLLQQYIEKDYDYLVYGCGLKDHRIYIPGLVKKLKLYPQKTGLGTVIQTEKLVNNELSSQIKRALKKMGYVGLFSVEYSHSSIDDRYYFIEFNFRNDALNSSMEKSGICFPALHVADLMGEDTIKYMKSPFSSKKVIFEMNHYHSMKKGETPFLEWLKDIFTTNSFKVYYKEDRKPFIKQFSNLLKGKMSLVKKKSYK